MINRSQMFCCATPGKTSESADKTLINTSSSSLYSSIPRVVGRGMICPGSGVDRGAGLGGGGSGGSGGASYRIPGRQVLDGMRDPTEHGQDPTDLAPHG